MLGRTGFSMPCVAQGRGQGKEQGRYTASIHLSEMGATVIDARCTLTLNGSLRPAGLMCKQLCMAPSPAPTMQVDPTSMHVTVLGIRDKPDDPLCAKGADIPADASEEPQQVGIPDHVSPLIAHGFDELVEPDGRVCEHGAKKGEAKELERQCSDGSPTL